VARIRRTLRQRSSVVYPAPCGWPLQPSSSPPNRECNAVSPNAACAAHVCPFIHVAPRRWDGRGWPSLQGRKQATRTLSLVDVELGEVIDDLHRFEADRDDSSQEFEGVAGVVPGIGFVHGRFQPVDESRTRFRPSRHGPPARKRPNGNKRDTDFNRRMATPGSPH
jgi:hypothetical protein